MRGLLSRWPQKNGISTTASIARNGPAGRTAFQGEEAACAGGGGGGERGRDAAQAGEAAGGRAWGAAARWGREDLAFTGPALTRLVSRPLQLEVAVAFQGGLVPLGSCNSVVQSGWRINTRNVFLPIWRRGIPRSGCQHFIFYFIFWSVVRAHSLGR